MNKQNNAFKLNINVINRLPRVFDMWRSGGNVFWGWPNKMLCTVHQSYGMRKQYQKCHLIKI